MDPLDARVVPFRRPWGRVPAAAAAALLAVALVGGGLAVRLAGAARCAGDASCPVVAERPVARSIAERDGVYVWGDASGGASLAGATFHRAPAPASALVGHPSRETSGTVSIRAAREDALTLRWWEVAALTFAALWFVAALVERQVRFGPVVLDGRGLRAGRRRMLWEDLAATTWEDDHLVAVDHRGGRTVVEGVALDETERAELQRLSDRLVGQRAGALPDGLGRVRELAGSVALR